MSAFIVEAKTINAVIYGLKRDCNKSRWFRNNIQEKTGYDLTAPAQAEQLGRALLLLNVQAVRERYDEDCYRGIYYNNGTCELTEYQYVSCNVSKIAALKALYCLKYQCTEGSAPESDLYKTLVWISNAWAYDIITSLPEYDSVPWG